jgi:hypothetical protein
MQNQNFKTFLVFIGLFSNTAMLSAWCFSLNRLVAVTLPQGGINDGKKIHQVSLKTTSVMLFCLARAFLMDNVHVRGSKTMKVAPNFKFLGGLIMPKI